MEGFDWKNPDYLPIFRARVERLARIRQEPEILPGLMAYYRERPADFINDWGMTSDTRNVDGGIAVMPFLLFKRQREWIEWVHERWLTKQPGLTEKSRDMGASWLSVAFAVWMCVFYRSANVGFGSRKEEYVDKKGSPKALFYKARQFASLLPPEFRGGFIEGSTDAHMILRFPETGSTITGEAGDGIGRGDRAAIYFVDESAHLERPQLIDTGLANTTNCRIDISSVNGMGNPFAQKRHSWPDDRIFIFDWREDPRKDLAWYDKYRSEHDEVTVAQEVDRDYSASKEGIVIPGEWARAAIDAHIKLGLAPSGERILSLDVADEGIDTNAVCGAYGQVVDHVEEWTGKGSDIFQTVKRAIEIAAERGYDAVRYDADGLGAGVRGDARIINEQRVKAGLKAIPVEAFRGSEGVFMPEAEDEKGRKNGDFFANRKAQAWWALRRRFRNTYRAVVEGMDYDPAEIISISSKIPGWTKLLGELSQPTHAPNGVGKMVIDKTPEGARSPNLADAVMIRFSSVRRPMKVSAAGLRGI